MKKSENTNLSSNQSKKGEITRKQALKRIGVAGVATTSMLLLLQSKKAVATSVFPDNPGSTGGF